MELSKIYAKEKESPVAAVVTGKAGSGKTTWAIAGAPTPLILDLEGGSKRYGKLNKELKRIDCQTASWDTMLSLLDAVIESKAHKTVIIDSADHAAQALFQHLVNTYKMDIEQDSLVTAGRGYGHAYEVMWQLWRLFIDKLNKILATGAHVIVICHCDEKNKSLPNKQTFSAEEIRLPKKIAPLLLEWAELIGHLELESKSSDHGVQSTRKRILHTDADIHVIAKNRFGLEPSYVDSSFGNILKLIQDGSK